jgi:hypothetical protein
LRVVQSDRLCAANKIQTNFSRNFREKNRGKLTEGC